jgi:zinc transporter
MNTSTQYAYALSGPGAGKRLEAEKDILDILRAPELGWVHLRADDAEAQAWVRENITFVDPHAVTALIAEETRPRATPLEPGAIVILRGMNSNEGAEPEDMVSVRLWIDPARIVSMSRRPMVELREMAEDVEAGKGPQDAAGFLATLVERLNERIEDFLRELSDSCDTIEEKVAGGPDAALRGDITATRQRVIQFRRYISPQRDAVDRLLLARLSWFEATDLRRLMEAHDRLVRTVEDLDTMRDRLAVVKDELTNALSERLNQNLFLLSVITVIFLPLGFLTGLMGVNLAGMPGSNWPQAFWVFTGVLGIVALALAAWLHFRRWF